MVHSYPVNLRLEGRSCLIVGGGNVAVRKAGGLVAAAANVTVVAPQIAAGLSADSRIRCVTKRYETSDLDGHRLVITCTDDQHVNAAVYRDAERLGIWANSADDPINCAFTLPAVARRGDLQLTVATHGRSPALATWLRQRFEAEFDGRYETLLDVLAEVRSEAREVLGTSEVRGWSEALDAGAFDLVANGNVQAARELLRRQLGLPVRELEPARELELSS